MKKDGQPIADTSPTPEQLRLKTANNFLEICDGTGRPALIDGV